MLAGRRTGTGSSRARSTPVSSRSTSTPATGSWPPLRCGRGAPRPRRSTTAQMTVPYGDWIAYQPAVLAGAVRAVRADGGGQPVAAAAQPRRRRRAVARCSRCCCSSTAMSTRACWPPVPGLSYLLVRCAGKALGAATRAGALDAAARGDHAGCSIRRDGSAGCASLFVVLALVFLMVGVSSSDAVDVLYAVMEGATKLVHGVLPYGHMPPGIIHGDTYPILSYVLYTPLALFAPVSNVWDSVDGGLAVAVLAAGGGRWAVFRTTAGARPRARAPRPVEAEEAGLRAALAWLAFPPLLITVSTGTTDVVLAAMLAGGRAAVAPAGSVLGDARARGLVQARAVCAAHGVPRAAPGSPARRGAGGDRGRVAAADRCAASRSAAFTASRTWSTPSPTSSRAARSSRSGARSARRAAPAARPGRACSG